MPPPADRTLLAFALGFLAGLVALVAGLTVLPPLLVAPANFLPGLFGP